MNIIFIFESVKYSTIYRQWRSWSSGNSLLFSQEVLGSNICKDIESLDPGVFSLLLPTAKYNFNPLNAELNPICHLLALLGAHHILHVSRIKVKGAASSHFCIT